MVLTSFFDFIQAPSMRISLILHLNFAHIKPQQPNPVILVTILAENKRLRTSPEDMEHPKEL